MVERQRSIFFVGYLKKMSKDWFVCLFLDFGGTNVPLRNCDSYI